MSEETQLKREGTMEVTTKEGKEFLENQGLKVTDDDVKTRGQKEKLDQITSTTNGDTNGDNGDNNGEDGDKPKVNRESTMEVTAKEGTELLDGEELEKTRGQTAVVKEAIQKTTPEKPKVPRDSTMAVTTKEGLELLGGEELGKTRGRTATAKEDEEEETTPTKIRKTNTMIQTTEDGQQMLGDEELGKTRSQTRKFSESDEKKPAVKRTSTMAQTAQEGEEFLARESKRTKQTEEEDETKQLAADAVEIAED